MQVIILAHIMKLGKIGEHVEVKNGFGRNYLLSQGKALRASKNNIEFVTSIPSCNFKNNENDGMFKKSSKGTILSRLFSQISMLFNNLGSAGGLFVVIGKKNEFKNTKS